MVRSQCDAKLPRWLAPTRAATCHKLTLQLSRHGGRGGGEVAVMVNSCAERVAAALVRSGGWVRRARSTVQRCCGRHTPPRSLLAAWSLTGGHLLAAEDAKSRSRASQRTLRHGTQPAVPHGRERRCVRLVRSSDLRPEWLCYKARGPCWRSEIGVARREFAPGALELAAGGFGRRLGAISKRVARPHPPRERGSVLCASPLYGGSWRSPVHAALCLCVRGLLLVR